MRPLFLIALLSTTNFAFGEEITRTYSFPKITFDELLTFASRIEGKQVVVANSSVLNIETSMVVPDVSSDDALKVIKALLLLNGYELTDGGKELILEKVLDDGQCTSLNNGLGRDGAWPRRSNAIRPRIVRPREGEVEQRPKAIIVRPVEEPQEHD